MGFTTKNLGRKQTGWFWPLQDMLRKKEDEETSK